MRVGKMNRQVTIRAMTRTPDGMGGYTETPTDVPNVWAEIAPLDGTEKLQAMQTGMERPHEITIRYRPNLSAAQTLLYGTRVFDIKSVVDPEEKHRKLVILAEEVFA